MIRWTAILGGLIAWLGSYMLLALLGIATGLTAINPQAAEPVGGVPVGLGIWTLITMLIAAFVGGYIAARMSGLMRKADGVLHSFVTWAASLVLFAYLATTAVSALLGGTFALLGQGIQGAGSAAGAAAQGAQQSGNAADIGGQIQRIITGTDQGNVSPQDLRAVQQRLQSGDRQGAIDYMVNNMGFTQERAQEVVSNAAPLFTGQLGQQARQTAGTVVNALAAVSWWLFLALVLSLAVALWGGFVGAKACQTRTAGDHSGERRLING
jgi:hypothetical protein